MRVILNPRHAARATPHELDNGVAVPPWEPPGRFDAIRLALARRPGFACEDAPAISESAVEFLHDPTYVAYLREAVGGLRAGAAIYPSVFPFGPEPHARGGNALR